MKKLIKYFSLFRNIIGKRMYFILVLGAFTAFLEGIGIALFLPLLHQDTGSPLSIYLNRLFSSVGVTSSLPTFLFLIVIFFLLRTVFLIGTIKYEGKIAGEILVILREKLLTALGQAEYTYFINQELGYINNALTLEVQNITFVFKLYVNLIISLLFALVYLFLAILVDIKLVLFLAIFSFPFVKIAKKINAIVSKYSIETTDSSGKFQTFLIQTLEKYKYLKATMTYPKVLGKIFKENRILGNLIYYTRFWGAIGEYGFLPVVVIIIAGIVYYSVTIEGKLLVEVMYFLFLIKQISDQFISSQGNYRKLLNHIGSILLLERFEKSLAQNRERSGGLKIKNAQDGIYFKNVSFSFEERIVLENINMEFLPGKIYGLVGPLGVGKSTIFNLMTGILHPEKGNIFLGKINYRDIALDSLRMYIGYITQEDIIFNDTLLNNLTLWQNMDIEKIEKLLEECALKDFIISLPNGYDTILGESGIKISGGQRGIVFFLREVLKNPDVLLLDEFTSAMDAFSERKIIDSLEKTKNNRIVIMISHRLSAVRKCDYIYALKEGKVVEEGTYDELYKKEGEFKKMLREQLIVND
jgi:subfamily B ATP-binding cassette protein MsbA